MPSLLAVFAHPDDESLACGGLLALCADAGVRVAVLCLTHGEHGPGKEHTADGDGGSLGGVREAELRAAAAVLGVADVTVLDHEDGMVPWTDREAIEADIRAAIERTEPDVVVTFDEDGLYWHPDHIATYQRTTAVVKAMGAEAPALRYVTMPKGVMRDLVESGPPGPILGVMDPDAFGAVAPDPSYALDVSAVAARKLAALKCHRTQVAGSVFERLDEADAVRFLGTEHVRRARAGSQADCFLDRWGVEVEAGR